MSSTKIGKYVECMWRIGKKIDQIISKETNMLRIIHAETCSEKTWIRAKKHGTNNVIRRVLIFKIVKIIAAVMSRCSVPLASSIALHGDVMKTSEKIEMRKIQRDTFVPVNAPSVCIIQAMNFEHYLWSIFHGHLICGYSNVHATAPLHIEKSIRAKATVSKSKQRDWLCAGQKCNNFRMTFVSKIVALLLCNLEWLH